MDRDCPDSFPRDDPAVESLLLAVARCPIAAKCLAGELGHGCSKIVLRQRVDGVSEFQSPEPWSGHLSAVPILFLSSNPSIGVAAYDQYPRGTWDDKSIIEYFEHRFGGRPLSSVKRGIYSALPGTRREGRGIPFWIGVRARAAELLDKPEGKVVAGIDYALTEVVRCKSKREYGVAEARSTCVERYLEPTLQASVAAVIVVLGTHAKRVMCDRYGLDPRTPLHGRVSIGDKSRMVVFLPHPSSRATRKTFNSCLPAPELEMLRDWLKNAMNPPVG